MKLLWTWSATLHPTLQVSGPWMDHILPLTNSDHQILQDLQQLSTWSSTWLMSFNVKKCAVLSNTQKRKPSIFQYHLCNDPIPRANEYKYLGVTITDDLRWNKHCQNIRHKASWTLGLIPRTLSPCTKEVKARAYTALVRPQLEYASEAWNPHTAAGVNSLEQVQRSAARFVHGDYRITSSSALSALVLIALGWESSRTTSPCTVHSLPQDSLPSSQHSIPTCHYPSCLHLATRPQPQVCNPESNHRSLQVLFLPTNYHLPGPVVEINNPSTFREAAL